jgi:hypothetical protein
MGALSGILIVVTLYSKLFPMMSVWEVIHGAKIEESKRIAAEMMEQKEAEATKTETKISIA